MLMAAIAGEVIGRARDGGGAMSIEVARLQVFDGTSSKITGFIMAYKLYIKIKMREAVVEKQIQWVLSYVQGGSVCCSNHLPEWHLWYADFSKALSRLSSSGDYKRTRQGALAILLLYLYKYKVVCATTMCLPHVLLLIHHASTSRPPCHIHVPWCYTL